MLGVRLTGVDDHSIGQDLLYLCDSSIQLGLLVLRVIILAVLGQVAVAAGNLDHFGNFFITIRFQISQLILQFLITFRGKFVFFCHRSKTPFLRR